MAPDSWASATIGDIAELGSGATPLRQKHATYYEGGDIRWVKTGDLNNDLILHTEESITPVALSETSCKVYPPGTVLVAMYGGFKQIGRTGLLGCDAAINQALTAITLDKKRALPQFVQHWLNGRVQVWKRLAGSSRKDPNITKAEVAAFPILLPPLREQLSIVSVLATWDRSILHVGKLMTAKLRFKRGLMQQLFIGKRRFNRFRDEWQSVHLKDIAEECEERNRGRLGTESVMAVTKAEGIIPMRERTIATDIDRYSVVKKNYFAYNPMRLNIGSIARWTGEQDVLVSPDYVVFHAKKPIDDGPAIDIEFLDQYRRSSLWQRYVSSSGNGGVRVRIYFSDLGGLKLKLPSLPEQRKIASILNIADRELNSLRRELDALKMQKKGLMQQLLTGKVRVKP